MMTEVIDLHKGGILSLGDKKGDSNERFLTRLLGAAAFDWLFVRCYAQRSMRLHLCPITDRVEGP